MLYKAFTALSLAIVMSLSAITTFSVPALEDDTMVPARYFAETIGADVTYDSIRQTITFMHEGKILSLTVGEKSHGMPAAPYINDGVLLVPAHYIFEYFGVDTTNIETIDSAPTLEEPTEMPTQPSKVLPILPEIPPLVTTPPSNSGFPDVPNTHWAYSAIMTLVDREIVAGYEDGLFRPENLVMRNEFATILTRTLQIPLIENATPTFVDVAKEHWAFAYVETAKFYLTGYRQDGEYYFKGTEPTLREDISVALVKALRLDNQNVDVTELENIFTDYYAISPNLQKYVLIAYNNNLIGGYPDGTFKAQQSITRAETAALLIRVLNSEAMEKVTFDSGIFVPQPQPNKPTVSVGNSHTPTNTASATISPQIHVFPSAAVGYGKQAAQTFTITNTGDVRLWHADSRGAISGWFNFELDDSCVYEINGFSFIDPGETCSFSVSPGQRLDLGVHHGSVTRWFIPAASFEEFSEIIGGSSDVHVSDMLGHPDLMEISTNFSFTVTEEF